MAKYQVTVCFTDNDDDQDHAQALVAQIFNKLNVYYNRQQMKNLTLKDSDPIKKPLIDHTEDNIKIVEEMIESFKFKKIP